MINYMDVKCNRFLSKTEKIDEKFSELTVGFKLKIKNEIYIKFYFWVLFSKERNDIMTKTDAILDQHQEMEVTYE